MNKSIIATLRCPISGQALSFHDGDQPYLETVDGQYRYPVENGIAMLLPEDAQKTDHALAESE